MLEHSHHTECLRQLYDRRLKVANTYIDLQRHVSILEDLGKDGMSSDEPDGPSNPKQYCVLVKPWRNPVLASWLRTFDAVHRRFREDELIPGIQKGAQPHLRVLTDKVDGRRGAVAGLPRNAYNPDWLANLTSVDLEDLNMEPDNYDFSHTPIMNQ